MKSQFSPTEQKIIKILGKKEMTIAEITDVVHDTEYRPLNANNRISSAIRRINQKCIFYKLGWWIDGVGAGRAGRTVWRSKR